MVVGHADVDRTFLVRRCVVVTRHLLRNLMMIMMVHAYSYTYASFIMSHPHPHFYSQHLLLLAVQSQRHPLLQRILKPDGEQSVNFLLIDFGFLPPHEQGVLITLVFGPFSEVGNGNGNTTVAVLFLESFKSLKRRTDE